MNKRPFSIFGIALVIAGVLTGMLLFGLSTWANAEAFFYGFDTVSGKKQSSLRCPVFVTASDTAVVSMRIKNSTEKTIQATIRADISNTGAFRSYTERITIGAGQTRTMNWEVTADDMVLNRFIFLKAYRYAAYPLSTTEMTCGMVFVNTTGLSGNSIFWSLLSLSLLGMLGGLISWKSANPDPIGRSLNLGRALITIATLVALGIISALLGWWIAGIMLFSVCILISVVLLIYFTSRSQIMAN